ncbi:MAG: hypothetical protein M3R24_21525 [Chloroflexota bacterium]|nr:hypothetical protein [Chloroflexota bacterium]
MVLQIHQWYSRAEILAAFAGAGPDDVLCDGEFAAFPDTIACFITLGHTNASSRFTSASRFVWKPQRLDYAPSEHIPWFPQAAREVWSIDRRQRLKQHLLFTKTPSDEHYFFVGPVHLAHYGRTGAELSATFSLTTSLPRDAWLHFGGSLLPRQPFASLPRAELDSSPIKFHRKTLDLLQIWPPTATEAIAHLNQLEHHLDCQIPASVREWYSRIGCMTIMDELSLMHTPVDIVDYDDDLARRYIATPPHFRMLPVMFENQGVWHLAVVMNAEDDPPVYLGYQNEDTFEWHLHAQHFSDFVYAWACDYVSYERDYIIHTSAYMTNTDVAHIREAFQPRVTTYMGNAYFVCERIERYGNGDQTITLMCGQEGTGVWFSAETAESLQALLHARWSTSNTLSQIASVDIEMQKMYLW